MIALRPYKVCDAETVVSWLNDEKSFIWWSAGKFEKYPIIADDLNEKYIDNNGDCAQADNFYPLTAYDENGLVGHMIMRYVNGDKSTIRFAFVVLDSAKRGKGYGKRMICSALKYAFEILCASKVTIGVFEDNIMAYSCYKSVGFVEVLEDYRVKCEALGETYNLLELEMFVEDYRARYNRMFL